MKILVTGAAGFIGSHLAEALCRRGAQVVALDNLSLGARSNLAWKPQTGSLEFVEGNVADDGLVRRLTKDCHCIFHQAARPSVPYSVDHPLETNDENLDAALRLLIIARDSGVKRFIFASSSAIYGNSDAPAKHERLPPDPLSPYALQKYAAEKYGQLFHQLYGLETVSLRYFNVFGPRQSFSSPYSGVIAKFCNSMLRGESPVIFGDGKQSRDFTYIENVVDANLRALDAPAEKVAGKTFNIAGGQSISLLDLVSELNRRTNQKLSPRLEPVRAGDVRHSKADISAAHETFDYQTLVDWREGLARTLDFYRGTMAEKSGLDRHANR